MGVSGRRGERGTAIMQRLRTWAQVAGVAALLAWAVGCEDGGGKLGEGHDFGPNNPNLHIAIGDSITAGGYPERLAALLGKPVINLGIPGSKSDSGASRIGSALSQYRPGYVLILYGANDVTSGRSFASIIENLRIMVQASKNNQSLPVLATLTPMFYEHALWAESVKLLNQEIRALASAEGVALADLESAFGDTPQYLQSDGLHPTAEGQQLIAQTFYDVLN